MPTDFQPGQLAAHKTQPTRPWVVTVGADEREGLVQDVGVAYIAADGKRVLDCTLSCELVPYVDPNDFDAQFIALIRNTSLIEDEVVRTQISDALKLVWDHYADLTDESDDEDDTEDEDDE